MIYFWKHLLFTIDVQSRKPVTLALSSLWPKEWPKNGQKMATLSLSISKYVSNTLAAIGNVFRRTSYHVDFKGKPR